MLADPVVRKLIAQKLADVINGFVSERSDGILQEPQLTSRLGQRIEDVFDGARFLDYRVKAITEDIPDRGPNSMEKRTGADLYMGIEVDDGLHTVSKGIFIQAKWKGGDWGATACSELAEQSRKMMRRSRQGSFVFLYGPDGVDVVTARDCTLYPHRVPKLQPLQSVEHFFEDVFICKRGDHAYGVPSAGDMRAELKRRLERYGAKAGVLMNFIRRGDRSLQLADRRIWNTKHF